MERRVHGPAKVKDGDPMMRIMAEDLGSVVATSSHPNLTQGVSGLRT
jgi:hypothetical protein